MSAAVSAGFDGSSGDDPPDRFRARYAAALRLNPRIERGQLIGHELH